jgi:hypothetical protein
MKLLTKKDLDRLPALYSQEKEADPIAYVKFFCPWNQWTWYAMEIDKKDPDLCFGYVKGLDDELGYFTVSELSEITGPLGLKIERDLYFDPTPLSKLKNQ